MLTVVTSGSEGEVVVGRLKRIFIAKLYSFVLFTFNICYLRGENKIH